MRRSLVLGLVLMVCAGTTPSVRADDDGPSDTDRRYRQRERQSTPTSTPSPAPTPKPELPADPAKPRVSPPETDKIATLSKSQRWCIAIASFSGETQQAEASEMLTRVQREGGLPEAYLQKRDKSTLICVGRFADPDQPEAHDALKRVKQIEVSGKRPYIVSYLAPPHATTLQGRLPQYNLLRVHEQFGDSVQYTLQIAAYGRQDLQKPTEADLAEARKAAEQAVVQLRQDGEQAFYYHGPRLSMVTVGLFDSTDYDPQLPSARSQRLIAAQKRHPNNLYNGAGIKEKTKGVQGERLQSSRLVAIPKK